MLDKEDRLRNKVELLKMAWKHKVVNCIITLFLFIIYP
jgi:hypothetical protein